VYRWLLRLYRIIVAGSLPPKAEAAITGNTATSPEESLFSLLPPHFIAPFSIQMRLQTMFNSAHSPRSVWRNFER
jgi:hypothetical protein